MTRNVAVSLCLAAAVLSCSCVSAPIAYHDGLPAWTPPGGTQEFRIGSHRMFFSDESIRQSVGSGEWYITPGWRTGLVAGDWSAEYGAQALAEFRPSEFNLAGGVGAGIGRTRPSIALRLAWYGLQFGYAPSLGPPNAALTPYYQLSLLAGTDRKPNGLHGAAGFRMSPMALGPMVLGEYSRGRAAIRAEASLMLPPPVLLFPVWWGGPTTLRGRTLAFGLTLAGTTSRRAAEPGEHASARLALRR